MSCQLIGIDLGTTYSCVAIWRNGKAEIITNDQGKRTTPSLVAFTENERLVGNLAKNQIESNPKNTVYNAKRLIGRYCKDKDVQDDMRSFSFDVENKHGRPIITVQSQGVAEMYCPEEISAMILRKLKARVEKVVGFPVQKAVITVPHNFNVTQREATKLAARIAGLDVLRLITEPTAAALAYASGESTKEFKHVLVFDFGGGTFDVTILAIGANYMEVSRTGGDKHLGGIDIDNRLIDYCMADIEKTIEDKTIFDTDKASMQRLRNACEEAKCVLSESREYKITLKNLFEGKNFEKMVTRAKFNELNKDIFNKTLNIVEKVVEDAGMQFEDIADVVLVGGSTRIPKIRDLLRKRFNRKAINELVQGGVDEAVAIGAAITAGKLKSKSDSEPMNDSHFVDVNPSSLGIEDSHENMVNIIESNVPLPFSNKRQFTTHKDGQKDVYIKIYGGENSDVNQNVLLGAFQLDGIKPAPAHEPIIWVDFHVSEEGILTAKAVDEESGSKASKTLQITLIGRVGEAEIQQMIVRLNRYEILEAQKEEALSARDDLRNVCDDLRSISCAKFNQDQIEKEIQEIEDWLECDVVHSKAQYIQRIEKLKLLSEKKVEPEIEKAMSPKKRGPIQNENSMKPKKYVKNSPMRFVMASDGTLLKATTDWYCGDPGCKMYNFAHCKKCQLCKKPKP